MSIYKEKVDFFDAAFKQIAHEFDSDSDGLSKSQEVQESREDATTNLEPAEVGDDECVDLDDSIEFLGATGGGDDESPLEKPKIDVQPETRIEDVAEVDDVVIEEQQPDSEQPTTGPCRRSKRLQSKKKKRKTPPKTQARNKQKTPPKEQQHVIDVTISDDDEPMVVHATNNVPQHVVRTPTPRTDIRTKNRSSRNNDSIRMSQTSFEDYSYNLKLMRFGVMEQYETTWHTKLSIALENLITDCKTSGKVLVLTKRNEYEPLPLDGTPHSLSLDSGTILNAIAVLPHQQKATQEPKPRAAQPKIARDPNIIYLKLQDGQRKHTKEYPINLREPIGKLRKAYAEEFGHKLEDMKLLNEGDACSDCDTPLDLELEDGYMLDVVVSH